MNLRPELLPPVLDESLVARLAQLASAIDGAPPGAWEDNLDEFNRLAGTNIPFADFQGIYGAEEHVDYVRRVLFSRNLRPDPAITLAELTEIVERILAGTDRDFYRELFVVNCRHPAKSDLIYWPDTVDQFPPDREPTPAEIAHLALHSNSSI